MHDYFADLGVKVRIYIKKNLKFFMGQDNYNLLCPKLEGPKL